ncbi:hypothetical protein B0T14DRAFT_491927 [Immersiella caudata]|uniref:Uncharacterized protein n=1 Tax=Immersiella caudata TaxID=314043 RepID=A0AA39XI96_9PEZI|nr:hypothetical protein B0T14DRAFT_491927 [Immersiella caudata]
MGGLSYAAVVKRAGALRNDQPKRTAPNRRTEDWPSSFPPLPVEPRSEKDGAGRQQPPQASARPTAVDAPAPTTTNRNLSPDSMISCPENLPTQKQRPPFLPFPDPVPDPAPATAPTATDTKANINQDRIRATFGSSAHSVSSVRSCPGNIATFTHTRSQPFHPAPPPTKATAQTTPERSSVYHHPAHAEQQIGAAAPETPARRSRPGLVNIGRLTWPADKNPADPVRSDPAVLRWRLSPTAATRQPPPAFQHVNPMLEQQRQLHQEVMNRLSVQQVAHQPVDPRVVAGFPPQWRQQAQPAMFAQQYGGLAPPRTQQWIHRDLLNQQYQPVPCQQPIPVQVMQQQQQRTPPQRQPPPVQAMQRPQLTPPQRQLRQQLTPHQRQTQSHPASVQVTPQQPLPATRQPQPWQHHTGPGSSFHEQQMWVYHHLLRQDQAGFHSPPDQQPFPNQMPQHHQPAPGHPHPPQQPQHHPWGHYQLPQGTLCPPQNRQPQAGPSQAQAQSQPSTLATTSRPSPSSGSLETTATLERQLGFRLSPSELTSLRLFNTPPPPYTPSPRHLPLPSYSSAKGSASADDFLAGFANSPEHTHWYPVSSSPSNHSTQSAGVRRNRRIDLDAVMGVYKRQLSQIDKLISETRDKMLRMYGTGRDREVPAWFGVLKEFLCYRDYCVGWLREFERRKAVEENEKGREEKQGAKTEESGGEKKTGEKTTEEGVGEKEMDVKEMRKTTARDIEAGYYGDDGENWSDESTSKGSPERTEAGDGVGSSGVATAATTQQRGSTFWENTKPASEGMSSSLAPWEGISDELRARWREKREQVNNAPMVTQPPEQPSPTPSNNGGDYSSSDDVVLIL